MPAMTELLADKPGVEKKLGEVEGKVSAIDLESACSPPLRYRRWTKAGARYRRIGCRVACGEICLDL